ncbi:M23 family metallopeptidase [Pseudonocardia hydrocarbonoxydans]|uniref:M23 family metallopeptidase n=1 Tax=Pseudonocardia hydrocarbonoxydans TaxID=76726 RepID=UPI0031DCA593
MAGGLLALAGETALAAPPAIDDMDVSRFGVAALTGTPVPDAVVASAAVPVPLEPQVADAAALIKAVDLERIAADEARRVEAARVAEEARAAEEVAERARQAASAVSGLLGGGGVQMMTGRITSGYGPRWDAQHKGLDIAAPVGSPIRVPLDGIVIDSGPASGFGLWVRVRHADGTITLYGHIDRTLVQVGQRVSAGETIAEVGNRGRSTGPHLHFEVIAPGGGNVNPTPWLEERGIAVT